MNMDELYNKIINTADIVEIISEVVSLTPKGSSYFGLCPFHPDKNPSMSVSREKKLFNCFSCGTKGNVISFYSKYNNLTYQQGAIELAKKLGIEVDHNLTRKSENDSRLYKVMNEANSFYQFLLHNSIYSSEALKYLNERNINEDIIEKFKIGLAPSELNSLNLTLNDQNISLIDQVELGLVTKNDTNVIDVFRDRIMFPIIDHNGRVVGFSGRIYKDLPNEQAKYVNSKETSIFHKGKILYNFYEASKVARISDEIFIFEGFMDVIAAYKANVLNGVATMGTALTVEHVKAITSITKNIILCFDGDSAGIKALKRSLQIFSSFNIIPKAVILPDNLDPDEYLNKYGKEKLNEVLHSNLKNAVETILDNVFKKTDFNKLEEVEKFKLEAFDTIINLNQHSMVEFYLKKIATDTNILYETLVNDYQKYRSLNSNTSANQNVSLISNVSANQNVSFNTAAENKKVVIKKQVLKKHYKAMEGIIGVILRDKNALNRYIEKMGENGLHICPEFMLYTGILFTLSEYYNNENQYVAVASFEDVFVNPHELAKCIEISNSVEYRLGDINGAFEQNLNVIRELKDKLENKFTKKVVNNLKKG